jgi:shikimate kinase
MAVRAVFLVGFMACGKSSLGQQLAQRLDWDFVDLDAHIEAREQQTIAEIFRDRGEPGFRVAETSALRDLTESLDRDTLKRDTFLRNTVVALGGGAFAQSTNLELLRPWLSVFLDAPVDELWQRSVENAAQRPLRKDRTEFASLHQKRLPFYRQASVTLVTSGKDATALCVEIERTLHSWETTAGGKIGAGQAGAGKTGPEKTGAGGSSQSPPDQSGTGETQ